MQMGLIKNETQIKQSNVIVKKNFTHSCAIGQTGCGKTSSYIYPNLEDRIINNYSVLLYDYKGKEHLNVKYFANKNNRLDDVIEIGKDWGESINILKYMSKSSLEDLLLDLFGRSDKDIFWSRSSANVCLAIFDVLRITDNICNLIKEIDPKLNIEKSLNDYLEIEFNPYYTFKSLLMQTRSVNILKDFKDNIGFLYYFFINNVELLIASELTTDSKFLEDKYLKLFYEIEYLNETIEKTQKKFDYMFTSKQESTSIISLIMCINAPLLNIANIESLNNDKFDLIKALNDRKIVVVNVKSFSDVILSAFNNSLFNELTKNSFKNTNSISIFIDEAQRILSKNFDIPVDVLRECRVELFLSFQNKELLVQKIGKNKYESLINNIKNRYLFKNPMMYENYDLSCLQTFEYYDDEIMDFKINRSKPIFLSSGNSFDVELKYQKSRKIKQRYTLSKNIRNGILVYDEDLFSTNQVILKTKNEHEEIVSIFNKKLLNNAKNIFLKIRHESIKSIDYNIKLNSLKQEEFEIPEIL